MLLSTPHRLIRADRNKPDPWVPGINLAHPLAGGLVSFWSFQESVGGKIFDLVSGFHGTAVNGVSSTDWSHTGNGRGYKLDGSTKYFTIDGTNTAAHPLKPPLPLSMMVRFTPTAIASAYRILYTDEDTVNRYGAQISNNGSGTIAATYGDGGLVSSGASTRRSKVTTTAIVNNRQVTVIVVIRGATDMDIYFDGIDQGGSYSGTGGPVAYGTDLVAIGASGTGTLPTPGFLDLAAFWNRDLTPREARELGDDPYILLRRPD